MIIISDNIFYHHQFNHGAERGPGTTDDRRIFRERIHAIEPRTDPWKYRPEFSVKTAYNAVL